MWCTRRVHYNTYVYQVTSVSDEQSWIFLCEHVHRHIIHMDKCHQKQHAVTILILIIILITINFNTIHLLLSSSFPRLVCNIPSKQQQYSIPMTFVIQITQLINNELKSHVSVTWNDYKKWMVKTQEYCSNNFSMYLEGKCLRHSTLIPLPV